MTPRLYSNCLSFRSFKSQREVNVWFPKENIAMVGREHMVIFFISSYGHIFMQESLLDESYILLRHMFQFSRSLRSTQSFQKISTPWQSKVFCSNGWQWKIVVILKCCGKQGNQLGGCKERKGNYAKSSCTTFYRWGVAINECCQCIDYSYSWHFGQPRENFECRKWIWFRLHAIQEKLVIWVIHEKEWKAFL